MAKKDLTYKIEEQIGVLSENKGITIECNFVSFNDAPAKIDIRKWDRRQDEPKMWKGISLTEEEAKQLIEHLSAWFSDREMLG